MTSTNRILQAVERLGAAVKSRGFPRVFAGPDGFVDEIIHVVDKRLDVNNFTRVRTIGDYASRLAEAAGKSANVEFVVDRVKLGGNGPLMCEAFGRLGGKVRYVGAVGWPEVDPIFAPLKQYGPVIPVAPPGVTLAAEFEDGKIMHGKHQSLREVTWENIVERSGGLERVDEFLAEADLVALVNWTMLPFLTEVFRGIRSRLDALKKAPEFYFFDLADPAKRTLPDILGALEEIARFHGYGRTAVLGLNEAESLQVCNALGIAHGAADNDGLMNRAERIATKLGLDEVVIHPIRCAAAWGAAGHGSVNGPFCPNPRLTTGAGDHFNGGYMFGRVMGLAPAEAVVIGKCVSGFYVREGRGPDVSEVEAFGERWAAGTLDPW